MYRVSLSKKELEQLILQEKKYKTRDIKRRFRTIRLKSQWMRSKEICDRLEVSPHAVTSWIKLYLSWWIEALSMTKYHTRRSSALDLIEEDVKNFVSKNDISSIKEIQRYVYQKTNKQYDISRLWKWVKRKKIFFHKKTLF